MRITDRYTRVESSFGDSSQPNEGVSDSDSLGPEKVITGRFGTEVSPSARPVTPEFLAEFRH